MKEIKMLVLAIENLRFDLPGLVGADWPQFEASLDTYLAQLEESPEHALILRAKILALFGRHAQAHRRLVESLAHLQGEASHSTRGLERGIRSGSVPEKSPSQHLIARYTDIACPRRIWVRSPCISVVVRLTVAPPTYSAAMEEMMLHEHLPVQVRIEAPCFEILNASRQDIVLVRDQDSAPVVFDLRPLQVGHTDITFDFFQSGNPVGTATVAVEVTPDEVAEGTEARPGRALLIEPSTLPPDRVLHVAWNPSSATLQFTLIQDGAASWNDGFQPIPLNGDPAAHAAELYRQITSLVNVADPTVDALLQHQLQIPYADVDRRVRRLGQNLWRDLIPDGLKSLYGRERDRWHDHTLLLISDEPHIPWELVWPYEAGAWEDESPWCQTLRLTRWLRKDDRGNGNESAPRQISANALAVLAPTYSLLKNLPSAQQERQLLLDLIQQAQAARPESRGGVLADGHGPARSRRLRLGTNSLAR